MLDLRYAVRSLSRAKGFTIAVVLTLGLGIGANTAIFSVVRGVLLKPLPHQGGDRLMYLRQSMKGPGGDNIAFSVPEIDDFRNSSKTLSGIAEYSPVTFTMVEDGEAVRIDVGLVTGNYFSVMGLSPVLGRAFDKGDDGPGAAPVMMLTYDYWQKRFGGDPNVVGKSLRIGGKAVPVVGVLQAAPAFPQPMAALMNMVNSEHHVSATMVTGRTHRMTEMIARLAPSATVAQARGEVADITRKVHADFPEAYDPGSGYQVTLTPFQEVLGHKARLTLFLLMGAAAFVLVIACANVTNLTLMRGVRREHELVVRAALGAGTQRLRRLLLAENLVLALLGGALGLFIAFGGVGMLAAFAERMSPRAGEIRVDGVVLGFTLLLTLIVAALLSYAPRLTKERALGATLAMGGKRTTGGARRQRVQQTLVVAQIAVSVVLLTGAGLLIRTMQRLSVVDDGLTGGQLLTMQIPPDYTQPQTMSVALYERIQSQVAAIPGVQEVGLGSTVPLRSEQFALDIKAEGRLLAPGEAQPHAEGRTAAPDYFRISGIPLIKGREFQSTDRKGSDLVVILNKTLADQLFPGQEAVGRRVAWTGDVLRFIGIKEEEWMTVVGVVGDTKDGGLDAAPVPVLFRPFAQTDVFSSSLVIKASGDPAALAGAAAKAVRAIAPEQPVENILTIEQIRDESVAPRRLNALLIASFGLLAVVIAAVGIAGVLAFSVSSRTNEIGIRMTLGADASKVQRMILGEGGLLLVLGLALGVAGSLLLSRLIQGLLFGVAPHDPVTLGLVAVLMAVIGIAACWIPAARASRIDPGIAIRSQ
jgi:putative ABC transport system permease protein